MFAAHVGQRVPLFVGQPPDNCGPLHIVLYLLHRRAIFCDNLTMPDGMWQPQLTFTPLMLTRGMPMLPLLTEFEDRLFRYAQVSREGDLAIFTQTHKASGHVRYEVVLIRIQKEHTWPTGVTTPEKEAYPGSTTWGRFGQTCTALAEAQALAATWRQQREASSLPEEAEEETEEDQGEEDA